MNKKLSMKIYGFIIMVLLGIVYSYSVFRIHLEDDYSISTVYSGFPYMFKLLFFSVSMGFSGYIYRRFSARKIAIVSTLLVVIGFFMTSLAGYVNQPYIIPVMTLGYGVFVGLGIGPLYMLPLRVLSSNLKENLGFWTGATLIGIGISPLFFSPLLVYLLDYLTIFQVFFVLGILYAIILPLFSLNLAKLDKTIDVDHKKEPSVLKNKNFYKVYFPFFIVMFIGLTLIGLTVNIGVRSFGIDQHLMAFYVGVFSIFNGLGRPLAGKIIDKWTIYKTSLLSLVSLLVMSVLSFLNIQSSVFFLIMIGFVFLNFGAWLSIAPISTRKLFGHENYSRNYGYMYSAYGISAFIGTWLSSYIFDLIGLNGIYYIVIFLLITALFATISNKKVLDI